jgi:hypothetical protein
MACSGYKTAVFSRRNTPSSTFLPIDVYWWAYPVWAVIGMCAYSAATQPPNLSSHRPNKSVPYWWIILNGCVFLHKVKGKDIHPCYRPWRPTGLRDVEAPTLLRQTANRWRQGCQPYAPAALYPQVSWYSFLLEAESSPGPQCGRKD